MKYPVNEEKLEASLKVDGDTKIQYSIQPELSKEDKAIEFVKFNQGMEGFEMTPESESRCRKFFKGEITEDEAVKEILKEHGFESEWFA